jgi:hypothetical protein
MIAASFVLLIFSNLSLIHLFLPQPDDYISFFSLRNWAKMRGDVLTTEMVICTLVVVVDSYS